MRLSWGGSSFGREEEGRGSRGEGALGEGAELFRARLFFLEEVCFLDLLVVGGEAEGISGEM